MLDLAAEHEKWRTDPTDLAGWAMRAEQMYAAALRAEAALEEIQVLADRLQIAAWNAFNGGG